VFIYFATRALPKLTSAMIFFHIPCDYTVICPGYLPPELIDRIIDHTHDISASVRLLQNLFGTMWTASSTCMTHSICPLQTRSGPQEKAPSILDTKEKKSRVIVRISEASKNRRLCASDCPEPSPKQNWLVIENRNRADRSKIRDVTEGQTQIPSPCLWPSEESKGKPATSK
jgi:hypothetical protein